MLIKVDLVHDYAGVEVINSFGLEFGDGTLPQDVADAVATLVTGSAWMTGRSDQMSLTKVRAIDDTPGLAATGENVLPTPEAGDDATNGTPPLCAVVVQWKGASKGKAGRGRLFLAGYPASTAISGFWTSDALDPASAAASVLFDAYGPAGSGQLCIINRSNNGGTPGGPQIPLVPHVATLVKAFGVDNVVRRQGRREQGRGA